MEVLAGAGFAGVNGVVKAVTGKSILQHCGIAVNRLRANVLGIGAEYMGHALADKAADKAWKAAEAKLAGPDRDERLRFSCRLEALSDVLQSVASSRVVEDDSVKTALDNLRSSLERAFKAAGSDDGRRSSEADIDSYKQNLQQVFAAANAKRAEESHDDIREIREMLATEDSFKYDPYDSDSDQEASLLGEGSFGATHTMRNVDDGHLYAVKLIKIKKAGVPIESLRQEASRLRTLYHPNIVRYYTSFTKKKCFAIVTELLTGGSLLERIDGAAGPLPAGQIKRWTIQIASALAHMHAQRMQHRDLKPDNVLFDARGDARLIDLGLAKIVVAKSKVSSKNAVGAELYRSPEKALGRAYDAKDDIWALGCMVAGAVTGKSLEARSESGAGVFALDREEVKSLVDEAVSASSTFGELVAATLEINPIARPAAEIIELALRSGKSLAAAARDGTIFEEEDDDATSDALDDVPYAEVVGVEPSGDAPSENGPGKVRASATSAGSTAHGTPTAAEADAAASRGDFGPLVALLRTGSDGAKEKAATALANLARGNADKIAIAKAGAMGPLVALLRTGSDGAKEKAAGALANLARGNADNKIAIAKAGAMDPLVALLRTGTDGNKNHAAYALKSLPSLAESRAAVAQALSLSAAASKSDVDAAIDKARS